jgi:hypothetical protein
MKTILQKLTLHGWPRKVYAAVLGFCIPVWSSAQVPDCQNYGNGKVQNVVYAVNGTPVGSLAGNVSSGDTLKVCFTLKSGCAPTILSLVSYKAPGPTFDMNTAHLQTVYDMQSGVFTDGGTCCLTVVIPDCYFQVDFVYGCVIHQLGPGNLYGGRLIDQENGGKGACNCVANANAGTDLTLTCHTASVTLSGSTTVNNPIINWQAKNGGTISAGANTLTPTITSAGTYILYVTDSLQCIAKDSVKVKGPVNNVKVNLGNDLTVCAGTQVTLNAGNPGLHFLWSTGATTQTIVVNATGNYSVTVTDGICSSTDAVNVTVIANPVVNLGSDFTLCAPSVKLDAGNPGMSYSWNTGATTQTITANSTGTYYVTVKNAYGCKGSDTINIKVAPPLYVNLGNDLTLCAGASATLNAGNPGMNYLWSTGASTQTIVVNTTGKYYVTVMNGYGCKASDTVNIKVLPPVTVNLGNDLTLCHGASATLNAGNPGSSYAWNTGATTQTIVVSTTGKYYVTVKNSHGCKGSDTINVKILPPLYVNLGNDLTLCYGASATLNAGNPGLNYLWNTGATTQTIVVNSTGKFYVTVKNSYGCKGSDTVNVKVLPAVYVNLGNDLTLCYGASATLNAGNPGMSYQWNTGATTQTIVVNATGKYHVTVKNSYGCKGSDTINVKVLPQIYVNLGNDLTLCHGTSATLNAGNPGLSYQWNTGATTQTIVVNATGKYYVTVKNAHGCKGSDTINVKVLPAVYVNLGNDLTLCHGASATLNAGNPGFNYLWNTGATTQTIVVNSSGKYYVTVKNSYGCKGSDTINVKVLPPLYVNLGNDLTLCYGASATLNAGNPGMNYQWNTGATTQTIVVNTTGKYYVTVKNSYGCKGSDTVNVTVLPGIYVDLGKDTVLCAGASVTLNAGNPGMSYQWNTGATMQTIVANSTGSYWVTVKNAYGCKASDTIHVKVLPPLYVNLGNDTVICAGASVTLNAGNPGLNYQWNTGATTQTIVVNSTGSYYVTVKNKYSCKASDTIYVKVLQPLYVNLGKDTVLCAGASVTLNAGNPGLSYQWNTGATIQTIVVNSTGTYYVTVKNSYGCKASDSIYVKVLPPLYVNLGKDTVLCAGANITLTAGNPGLSYQWNTGATTQTIIVNSTGLYYVNVKNSYGCKASDTIHVKVLSPLHVNLGNDTVLCAGASLTLNAGNPGLSYLWNTGATAQTILVNATGTYFVTVKNKYGCQASDTIYVKVLTPLYVNLGKDTVLCAGGSIVLNAGNPGLSFLWNTGATTQTINVNATATYYVTVKNAYGCKASDTINVKVLPPLYVNLGNDLTLCYGASATLNAGNGAVSYLWNTGATMQTIVVNSTGKYYVTVKNSYGCTASDTINVKVLPPLYVNLGNDTTITLCKGQFILDAGAGATAYLWNTGATTQTIGVSVTGTYSVVVMNAGGCTATDKIHVTVNPGSLTIDLGNDTVIVNCKNDSLLLDAGVAGGTYVWSTGATTQTIYAVSTGTYYVTVTDSKGCTDSDTIKVVLYGSISVNLGPDATVCGCITLNAYVSGGTSYQWCNGSQYPTLKVCTTGVYCVTVSNGVCTESDTIHITVLPVPIVKLGNDTIVMNNLTLNAGNPGATYLWNNGATTQMVNISASGQYIVAVTGTNGCVGRDTIIVNVLNGIEENMQNAFQVNAYPNPSNHTGFTLSFEMPEREDVEIRIINTLGMVVYSEKIDKFQGTYRNRISTEHLASGIYVADISAGGVRNNIKISLE